MGLCFGDTLRMSMQHAHDVNAGSLAIETEGREAFGRLRAALAGSVRAALGEVSAAEVADGLGLSRKLGWQVWRLAFAADPFGRAGVLPTRHSLEQVLARALEHGAPASAGEELARAISGFEAVRQAHKGSRELLEAMLRSVVSPSVPETISESVRRDAHDANCMIWGSEIGLSYTCDIFAPNPEKPSWLDMTYLSGLYSVRRLRPTGRCIVHGLGTRVPSSAPAGDSPTPLMDGGESALEPLILPFCTHPIPAHRALPDFCGQRRVELVEGSLGDAGSVSLVSGEWNRLAGPHYREGKRRQARFSTHFMQPIRHFVFDLILHREVAWPRTPRVDIFGELGKMELDQAGRDPADLLPVECAFQNLGQGLLAAVSSEIPQHHELLRWTFRRVGWDIEEFTTLRLSLRYPVLPSCLTVAFDLSEEV